MIPSISSTAPLRQCLTLRRISTTALQNKWKLVEKTDGNTTTVKAVKMVDTEPPRKPEDRCALCTCNIPIKLAYTDVLVLEQFMRPDGTVLPRQLTGICKSQQLRLERCVMQAHWAGLFPDRTIPEFDRAGYKRFSRYWRDDMSMYFLTEKKETGTWYYLKRYPSKDSKTWKRLEPS
ncbi:unnamed protein product, partial [Mesorhabditis belari]|uniref:Mitochondrial ribosomal protein S18A n=1 Tax=Mesorhabditis belari TaxID=2138241 RepID=A0AAF3EFG2_9BILA